MAAAIPFALAGLAVAVARSGSRRVLLAIGVLIAYWAVMAYEESAVKALIQGGAFFPEYLCAWTPNLLMLIVTSAILSVRHTRNRTVTAA